MGKAFKDKDMQAVIGWVLRLGVLISMLVVFIGGIIYLYRHGHTTASYHQFKGVPDFVTGIPNIFSAIVNGRGRAIIQAGIILLIITPIVRVAFSIVGFIIERDWLYTGISVIVLLIILFSAISGHAG
ncbi:DUF1634 domain-containing protein [Mucilaginibacter pallidiroseus]|uniref:DUF1634 domain-containing protein n=2 Tax=Mucilaginibacter pallidiroseus TaxID=2599295 RepID=A0A563U8E4_9SPHI|nr:DUF1634 domain-containing protein [Mucilaginibacter pallidiroseus]